MMTLSTFALVIVLLSLRQGSDDTVVIRMLSSGHNAADVGRGADGHVIGPTFGLCV